MQRPSHTKHTHATTTAPSLNRDFPYSTSPVPGGLQRQCLQTLPDLCLGTNSGNRSHVFHQSMGRGHLRSSFLIFASSAGYLAGRLQTAHCPAHQAGRTGGHGWRNPCLLCTVCSRAPGGSLSHGSSECLFWPAKYGILPELLPSSALSKANGWQQAFVYMAIVLGAGMVLTRAGWQMAHHIASLFCVGISVLGWLLAKGIGPLRPVATQTWHFNPLKGVTETYEKTRRTFP